MSHRIAVRKSSHSRALSRPRLERLARRAISAVLDGEGIRCGEVSVIFVDDPAIRRLNRRYRKVDRATDVMAFALAESAELDEPGVVLGDIVVSLPTARRQALALGHSIEAELSLLLVHGALHLLGYDHQNPDDAKAMRRKERRYLKACGVSVADLLSEGR